MQVLPKCLDYTCSFSPCVINLRQERNEWNIQGLIWLSIIFERKMHSSKGMSDALKDRHLLDQPTRPKTAAGFAKKGISGIKRPASGKHVIWYISLKRALNFQLSYF